MDLTDDRSMADYDDILNTRLENLHQQEHLGDVILERSLELVEDLPMAVKQHYRPRFMAAGALHVASREHDDPRNVRQLAEHVDNPDIADQNVNALSLTRRCVKKLKEHHGLDLQPVLVEDYLPYILDQLDASQKLREAVQDIWNDIRGQTEFNGRSQVGLATGLVFHCSQNLEDLDEVSAADLADVVVRNEKTVRDAERLIRNMVDGTV